MVLLGAGAHAASAADALVDVDDHAPPVVRPPISFRGRSIAHELFECGAGRGQHQQLPADLEEVSPAEFHAASSSLTGADCAAGDKCCKACPGNAQRYPLGEKSLGLAASFSWQRQQRLATSGSLGTLATGSSACLANGPWQALASDARMLSTVMHLGFLLVTDGALASARHRKWGSAADHVERARPVVSVFSKVLGHHEQRE